MSRHRVKDYWAKKEERFSSAEAARNRASGLRMHEHTSHVQVRSTEASYVVSYSVARWYLDELERAGAKL